MREGTDKYDDRAKGGYTYAEKLLMVSQDLMDPKEIGLSSPEEARREILNEEPPKPFLGDWMTFEAVIVPLEVREKWAWQDLKVKPIDEAGWREQYREEHKNEHLAQGAFASGSNLAKFGQTFADPILGFAELLRQAATLLEQRYEQIKAVNDHPVKTRLEIEAERKAGE